MVEMQHEALMHFSRHSPRRGGEGVRRGKKPKDFDQGSRTDAARQRVQAICRAKAGVWGRGFGSARELGKIKGVKAHISAKTHTCAMPIRSMAVERIESRQVCKNRPVSPRHPFGLSIGAIGLWRSNRNSLVFYDLGPPPSS